MNKLYKYKKLIICILIVLGFAIAFMTNTIGGHNASDVHHTYTGISYIKNSTVIDEDMVIRAISRSSELVGASGDAIKQYNYSDSIFDGSGWLRDHIGKRSLTMDVIAHFKTGINLSDITADNISVYNNSVFIKLPKHVLVSLDIPYSEIVFKTRTGLVRSQLSEPEKQQLYSEIRRLVTDEIMNDQSIHKQTFEGIKESLTNLLSKLPNINRVVIQEAMQ